MRHKNSTKQQCCPGAEIEYGNFGEGEVNGILITAQAFAFRLLLVLRGNLILDAGAFFPFSPCSSLLLPDLAWSVLTMLLTSTSSKFPNWI